MNASILALVLCSGTLVHAQSLGEPASVDGSEGKDFGDAVAFPEVFFDEPTKDTFTYPNVGASGNTRLNGWATYYPGVGRHSSMVSMFDTGMAGVPMGEDGYVQVISMEFTAVTYASGPTAFYDETRDPPENSLWPGGDLNVFDQPGGFAVIGTVHVPADPNAIMPSPDEANNAPVELFGARFHNEHTAASWDESAGGTPAYQNGRENVVPIDFDRDGTERDVTDNVASLPFEYTQGIFTSQPGYDVPAGDEYLTEFPTGAFLPRPYQTFRANPFAIGKSYHIPDGTPGHSIFGKGQDPLVLNDPIPQAYRLKFSVNVQNPWIQNYLQESIHEGWVSFVYSHLAFGDHAGGNFTYWMTKEGSDKLPPAIDVDPSTLRFTYMRVPFGDISQNGRHGHEDLLGLIRVIESQVADQITMDLADVNRDGRLDFFDIAELLRLIQAEG